MDTSSFIKDIGRSFLISCFLPASIFVLVGIVLFQDFIPKQAIARLIYSPFILGSGWLVSLLITTWTAFGLYSILPWTKKLYGGDYFPVFLQKIILFFMCKFWHTPRSRKIQELRKLKDEMRKSQSQEDWDACSMRFDACEPGARKEYLALEPYCPVEPELLLPTRLGNLLRSSMYYPKRRYNIDGDIAWPRLESVLPKDFLEEKDDSEARLIFLLNSSLLAYIASGLSIIGGLFGFSCVYFQKLSYCSTQYYRQAYIAISPTNFLIIGLVFAIIGYFLYHLAVSAGETFTSYVRAAFDLYRFELLKKLSLNIPENMEKERNLWEKVNELYMAGDELGLSPLKIDYTSQKKRT